MNKELLKYIKDLSINDKKTLSQKALKVSEESGELARVTLPLDNAAGTVHRFVDRNKVLEECVDVILTSISMAYDLNFTDEEIEQMMWRKSEKWQGIQSKEEDFDSSNIPFEIHITVDLSSYLTYLQRLRMEYDNGRILYPVPEGTMELAIEHFKKACDTIGVKPIVLDLENGGESVMQDVMTSSKIVGSNADVLAECMRISKTLTGMGLKVVREKIETVPWHPAAPQYEGEDMPGDCYFEAHVGCIITPEEKDLLQEISEVHDSHLSRNFFKKIDDGKYVNMITLRHNKFDYVCFETALNELLVDLDRNNITYEKVISEFSIYDTKVSHDFLWVKKEEYTKDNG
jgi:NTP pyrophosphatase (non-canonical NTP hydrolase)